jgi:hypothetical protein
MVQPPVVNRTMSPPEIEQTDGVSEVNVTANPDSVASAEALIRLLATNVWSEIAGKMIL